MADISDVTVIEKKEDGTIVKTTTYDIKDEIAREQLSAIPDGTYPDMTVGGVMSSDGSTDSVPYLYRESGGGVEVGTVEEDSIVGGTVAFNQLFPAKSLSFTSTKFDVTSENDGKWIVKVNTADSCYGEGNPTTIFLADGHKYISLSGNDIDVYPKSNNGISASREVFVGAGFTNVGVAYAANKQGTYTIYPMFIDLTQMFGSSVADYIYSLEQSTAGAGVAFFRKLFPKDYYEYNTGELLSVEGLQSHDMVGFNQWDEEWELGAINPTTGQPSSSSTSIRCKNFIPVLPNTAYCYHNGSKIYQAPWYYDAEKNFVKRSSRYVGTNEVFTIPDNAHYMKFALPASYGTTYNNDICINISSDRNGEYEPYIKHSYPLDSSLTLRGIPKLSDGLYFDGDTYEADGTVTRKYGVVDLGALTWTSFTSNFPGLFYSDSLKTYVQNTSGATTHGLCAEYPYVPNDTYNGEYGSSKQQPDKTLRFRASDGRLYAVDASQNGKSGAEFAAHISGVYATYALKVPTEETAQPYTEYQKVSKYGTEEYVSTGIVPVGHVTKYPTDIVSKVNGLPSDFSTLIAPTEKEFKASKAYSVNQFLIVNNQLYRVTASIANGATITVGTNVTATTVADILTQLLNA